MHKHNRCFPGSTRVLDASGISIASAVFARLTKWQTGWQTDRPRYSVGSNRRSAQWRSQILLLSMATTSIFVGAVDSNTPCRPFLRKRSPDGATPNWGRRHPIAGYSDLDWPLCHCAMAQAPPPLSTNIGAAIYAPSNDMTHLEWWHWTAADGTAPKTPLVRHWAYYSSIDREGMKGRVWPGWLTYSGRFTHISGNPSATGLTQDRKVRGSKTDVAMRCTDGGEIWRGGWLLHANQCRGMGVRGPPKLQILLKLRNIKANMDVFLGRFLPNCHRLWAASCTIM